MPLKKCTLFVTQLAQREFEIQPNNQNFNYQLSIINYQIINYQIINYQLSIINYPIINYLTNFSQ